MIIYPTVAYRLPYCNVWPTIFLSSPSQCHNKISNQTISPFIVLCLRDMKISLEQSLVFVELLPDLEDVDR